MTKVRVEVTDDFLAKLRRSPRRGVIELIDNALDADAKSVTLSFTRSQLGAIETVTIVDDGDGMTGAMARRAFGTLGDSWKVEQPHTLSGRRRRGRRGSGRWAAFSLGSEVTWRSTSRSAGDEATLEGVEVRGSLSSPGEFDIAAVGPGEGAGTVVTVRNLDERAQSADGIRKALTEEYAVALRRQPSLKVVYDANPLNAEDVIHRTVPLPVVIEELAGLELTVMIVEWEKSARHVAPALVLAGPDGEGLFDHRDGITRASWPYTAYVSWEGFERHRAVLSTPIAQPDEVRAALEACLAAIGGYVRARQDAARTSLIAAWKAEGSYPYSGDPAGLVEEIERDLFDVIAVTAAAVLEDAEPGQRKFSLTLLREAVARDPSHLGDILTEVLSLGSEQLAELHDLLQRTSLPAIITAAGVVTHRLDIINGLREVLYNTEDAKHVKERKHLHEIVAGEPWLFGDEYTTAVSDRSLTQVLKAHRNFLDKDAVLLDDARDDAPVLFDGRRRRIDLLLSRVSPLSSSLRQHLVVELKRPSHRLTADDIKQLEEYAFAVQSDSRFHAQQVYWDFVLVGTGLDEFAKHQADKLTRAQTPEFTVRVMTWDDLLHNREHQLTFIQDALDVSSNADTGVARLRLIHGEHLPEESTYDGPGADDSAASGE